VDRWRTVGWRDAWLPGLIAVLAVAEMAGLRVPNWGLGAALEVLACAALVVRRIHGLAAPTLAMLLALLMPALGVPLDEPSVPIAIWAVSFFALARYVADLRGLYGFALVLAVVYVDYHSFDTRHHNWTDVIFVLVLATPPYVLGRVLRRLSEQNDALERAQEIVRAQAARDERDRIARELHDVIAHSVSAMVVQTAAAQDLVRTEPARAESILADVARTGRRALAETGRLLHVIRDAEGELGLAPTPGLAEVPGLVEQFRANGLDVDLHLDDALPALPAGVDVSAYRIVQEALTNALRYSTDRAARLSVTGTASGVRIRTVNACNGATGRGSGLGLVGMKERVSVLGGRLDHGTSEPGLFEVDATLPVDA
jgi:signal transduction histidine kinase